MVCQRCSEQATVRITDVEGGQAIDRHFCEQDAAEAMGVPGPDEWEGFFGWVVSQFKAQGTLPDVSEMAQHGAVGASVAKFCRWRPDAGLAKLRGEVERRLAG